MRDMDVLAEHRSNIYGLLSIVYIKEPTDEFIKSLREPSILNTFKELGLNIGEGFQNVGDGKLLEDLVLEYTRLFIGPGKHISTYESVWCDQDGSLWGKSTSEVKRFIESSGLEYHADWTGLPDHVGVELEFMQKMIKAEALAWEKEDKEMAMSLLQYEQKFMDEHIYKWIPPFCKKVAEEATLSFYKEIADLTGSFIEFDKKEISRLLKEK
ncbi:MAG: molecular chaperone TorD family protein [Nitrospinae bacterium]|nr:molecular chaperone TorD family protein [Nitrospinota bacterium]